MVHFTLSQWKLGVLLAAHTEYGLRAVLLGTQPDSLIEALHKKFPNAERAPKNHILHDIMLALIRYPNAPDYLYKAALDLQGTAFQKSVWEALRVIPLGSTMSYSAVAEQLGRPKAYRAVAQACGANALPLVIPCHRVVGKQGLGGYRYGLPLKEHLLEEEARIAS